MSGITVARIYDETPPEAGPRILVDRLWPRGIAKATAPWDAWRKDLAPSNALRKRFHAEAMPFEVFADAYRAELDDGRPERPSRPCVLVTAAKDAEGGHAGVLRDWLKKA